MRSMPIGMDASTTDGTLVFDLDDQRVLANFDFHVPRDRWLRSLNEDQPSMIAPPGDLEFSLTTVQHKSFHLPIQARTDASGRRLRIDIGSEMPSRAVALSDRCIALLAGDKLAGFLISGIR